MWALRFLDKLLACQDCHREFLWSAGEQEFYAVMGFGSDPTRCPTCRKERRLAMRKGPARHEALCAECGKLTLVPFIPHQGRPVYCRECYTKRRSADVA